MFAPTDSPTATINRAQFRVATVLVLANAALTVVDAIGQPGVYRGPAGVLAVCLLAPSLAWCVGEAIRDRPRLAAIRTVVALSFALLAAHPLLLDHWVRYPPLLHVLGAAMHVTALGYGARAATVLVPVFAAGVVAIRLPVLPASQVLTEAALLVLTGLIATAIVHVLHRAVARVDDAVAAAALAQEAATRAGRRAHEEIRWDVIVHDLVLGALLDAGRARPGPVPESARHLARRSLEALAGSDRVRGVRQDLVDQIHADAARLGLTVAVELPGELLDDEVAEALLGGVQQALTNVARHSGTTHATVRGALGPKHATVTVADRGRGYDIAAPRRSGWATTTARMRAVGGECQVRSRPGQGTTVALTWDAHTGPRSQSRSEWTLQTFTPLMTIGAVAVGLCTWLGRGQWVRADPRLLAVVLAGIVGCTLATALVRPRAGWVPLLVVALAGWPALATMTTRSDAAVDWRYWQLSALTPALGALAFRFSPPVVGIGTAVAAGVGVSLVDLARGTPWWAAWVGPMPVAVVTTLAGVALRRSLERAWEQVTDSTESSRLLRLDAVEDEERLAAAARRTAALRDVATAPLTRIAGGGLSTSSQRADWLIVEASVRDSLVAPDLLDAGVQTALASARRRGADVVVDGPGPSATAAAAEPGYAALRTRLRAVICMALAEARSDSSIRIHWADATRRGGFTLAYVGAEAADVAVALADGVKRFELGDRLMVTGDDESVLLETTLAATRS